MKRASNCEECEHFEFPILGYDARCRKGHKPRFYMPCSSQPLGDGPDARCRGAEPLAYRCTMDRECGPEACAQHKAGACLNTGGECKFREVAEDEEGEE